MKNECRDLAKQLIKHFTFRYFHTVDANLKVMIEYRVTSRKISFDHVENKVETSRLNYTILRKKVKKKKQNNFENKCQDYSFGFKSTNCLIPTLQNAWC